MPDTPMDQYNKEQTDSWNFLNCDMILGTYPDTYINPMRKFNKESFGNLKFVIEEENSIKNRCPKKDHGVPVKDRGIESTNWGKGGYDSIYIHTEDEGVQRFNKKGEKTLPCY